MELLSNTQAKAEEMAEQVNLEDIENWLEEDNDPEDHKIMLIYGQDGTAKTGILMHYLHALKKRTLYLDIDGNASALWRKFHKDAPYIKVKNPLTTKVTADKDGMPDVVVDYLTTFKKIKLALKVAADNPDKYDAIVLDGLSTLLNYAAEQMKIEKNIQADGQVQMKYWMRRNARFLDILEQTRSIDKADKFFIGHDDFINVPGTIKVSMGGEVVTLGKTSSVIIKTNRMMDQRVFCEQLVDEKKNSITYRATIHKWREGMEQVNKTIDFAEIKDGEANWYPDKVMEVFAHQPVEEESE